MQLWQEGIYAFLRNPKPAIRGLHRAWHSCFLLFWRLAERLGGVRFGLSVFVAKCQRLHFEHELHFNTINLHQPTEGNIYVVLYMQYCICNTVYVVLYM